MKINDAIDKFGHGESLSLGPEKVSSEVLQHYLRAYHGRVDLAMSLGEGTSRTELLEHCRNLIKLEAYDEAMKILDKMDNSTASQEDMAEVYLEYTRIYLFQDILEQAERTANLGLKSLPRSITRLCLSQLLGDIYLKQKKTALAIQTLQANLGLAELYPNSHAAFALRCFLILALKQWGDQEEAERGYTSLYKSNTKEDHAQFIGRLVSLLRTESKLFADVNSERQYLALVECKRLSFWCSDLVNYRKCVEDLAKLQEQLPGKSLYSFPFWHFFTRHALLLKESDKSYELVSKNSRNALMLGILLKNNAQIKLEDFYQQLSSESYNKDLHYSYIKNSVSRLRKLLPENSVKLEAGMISLS